MKKTILLIISSIIVCFIIWKVVDYNKIQTEEKNIKEIQSGLILELENSTWTNTAVNVWKDNGTGLYWSDDRGNFTNIFNMTNCDFYATTPMENYAGEDANCGNAINHCAKLSMNAVTGQDVKSDWYLPSKLELMQAYHDGMFVKTDLDWATIVNEFWSSTEDSIDPNAAWCVDPSTITPNNKSDNYHVRCARRD